VVLCATLAGMEDFVEIKLWGDQRLDFLRRFYPFERGVPSHDTLNDVINAIDPQVCAAPQCSACSISSATLSAAMTRALSRWT